MGREGIVLFPNHGSRVCTTRKIVPGNDDFPRTILPYADTGSRISDQGIILGAVFLPRISVMKEMKEMRHNNTTQK